MSETYVSQLRKLNVVALEQEPSLFPFRFSMHVYGITLDQKCYRVKSGCKLARKGRYSCQANVKTSRFLESIQEMGCKCFTENGSNVAHHLIHHWICLFISRVMLTSTPCISHGSLCSISKMLGLSGRRSSYP